MVRGLRRLKGIEEIVAFEVYVELFGLNFGLGAKTLARTEVHKCHLSARSLLLLDDELVVASRRHDF